jgi:Secretion system C-terminal sorting domain
LIPVATYFPSKLFKTTVGGNNGNLLIDAFDTLSIPGAGNTPYPVITGIAVNPNNANNVYISFTGFLEDYKVWSSTDGGINWQNEDINYSLNNLPVNGVEYYHGQNEDLLFIPTDAGVYFKNVNDTAWTKYGDLPNVRVMELDLLASRNKIYAATFGRGIWSAPLPDPCLEYNPVPLCISSDTIFNTPQNLYSDLIVEEGATLTVKRNIFFANKSKLIVKRGARLIIENANLSVACDYTSWKGIEVWGTSDSSQYSEGSQGIIELYNARIYYAETGILTAKIDSNGFIVSDHSGGIIRMENSGFVTCDQCLKIMNYENFNPVTYLHEDNLSYFTNCIFNGKSRLENINHSNAMVGLFGVSGIEFENCEFVCDYFYLPPLQEIAHSLVSLYSVDDIYFKGSRFENSLDTSYGSTTNFHVERGIGIYSYDSDFFVDELVVDEKTTIRSEINNFYYGIKVNAIDTETAPHISNTDFMMNYRCAYLNGVSYAVFTKNLVRPAPSPAFFEEPSYGLYLDYCTQYTVEENEFYSFDTDVSEIGLIVNNSGEDDNSIYNNDFRLFHTGILAQNFNRSRDGSRGLLIKCNDFMHTRYDIAVTNTLVDARYKGIKNVQGSNDNVSSPGGNLFNLGLYKNLNYDNESEQYILYYMHDTLSDIRVYPRYNTGPTLNNFTAYNTPHGYDELYSCPPTDLGSGIPMLKDAISENNNRLNQVEASLQDLVDGGDTDMLAGDVLFSTPPEAMPLRDQLLTDSPYLSDTVMLEAVRKENVLNPAMLRDVLVANPQSAKTPLVMDEIDNRVDPLPDYMIAEIREGEKILEQKEVLENEKAALLSEIANTQKILLLAYRNDLSNQKDSLYAFYAAENNLNAKFEYAYHLIKANDMAMAQQLIDSIPDMLILDDNEQARYQKFISYTDVYKNNISNNTGMDSLALAVLRGLAYEHKNAVSAYARSIVKQADSLYYQEPIVMPQENFKAAMVMEAGLFDTDLETANSLFYCYPNPAADYFVADYDLSAFNSVRIAIEVLGVNGELVLTQSLNGNQNQQIIDIRHLKTGIYIVNLKNKGKTMVTQKITKIK